MARSYIYFILAFLITLVLDRVIKDLFLGGYHYENGCITLSLVYNRGVAFSMFAFLGEYLKYIQIVLILAVLGYLLYHKDLFQKYAIPAGMIIAGGVSNIADRFIHGGVVDFFHWHCGFDFPGIFNFADVMIDVGVVIILYISYLRGAKV